MQHVSLRQSALVALVTLGAWGEPASPTASTTAAAAARPTPRVWDVPRPIEAIDVPQRVEAGGMPVTMHAVRSKASAGELHRYFLEQFIAAGLFVSPKVQQLSAHPQVTGLDPQTRIAYTIFLQENPDRTTTAIFTETYTAEQKRPPTEGRFAPVMPGSTGLVVSRTEGAETLSYRAKATVEQARAFYAEVLGRDGYSQPLPMQFERQIDVLTVHARPVGDQVSVSVIHTQAGRGARPAVP
jgi:hypothetical protein